MSESQQIILRLFENVKSVVIGKDERRVWLERGGEPPKDGGEPPGKVRQSLLAGDVARQLPGNAGRNVPELREGGAQTLSGGSH